MTAAAPLSYPGSRVLAGWWRQLTSQQPRTLWVAHLTLLRVEALVRVRRSWSTDRFTHLLLESLRRHPGDIVERLDTRLHLGPQVLWQALHGLETAGLAEKDSAQAWTLTSLGAEAHTHGQFPRSMLERQAFHFRIGADGPPHFMGLRRVEGTSDATAKDLAFDVAHLDACIRQSKDWKERHGFPLDVEDVVRLEGEGACSSVPDWQKVIVAQPRRLSLALIVDAHARLQGFAFRPETWSLAESAVSTLEAVAWQESFAEVRDQPSQEIWRAAWQRWCRSSGLSQGADSCALEARDHRLTIKADPALAARLQAIALARDGELWLLAGEGAVRRAGQVDIVAAD